MKFEEAIEEMDDDLSADRALPVIRQIETVLRCKECNTEVIPVLNIRDNDVQLSCEKCRVTEFLPRHGHDDMRKHFKTEIYLAGVLMRSYT